MIEVFKTNITQEHRAILLIEAIQEHFNGYIANFDLEDCDHILRVNFPTDAVDTIRLQSFLQEYGCHAEILADEVDSYSITSINAISFISRFYHPA